MNDSLYRGMSKLRLLRQGTSLLGDLQTRGWQRSAFACKSQGYGLTCQRGCFSDNATAPLPPFSSSPSSSPKGGGGRGGGVSLLLPEGRRRERRGVSLLLPEGRRRERRGVSLLLPEGRRRERRSPPSPSSSTKGGEGRGAALLPYFLLPERRRRTARVLPSSPISSSSKGGGVRKGG